MALSNTRTLSTLLATVFLLLFSTANAQPTPLYKRCDNGAGNYTTNSTFSSNLNSLLKTLTSHASSAGGFSEVNLGSIPDRVYGLVLCRGDTDDSTCQTCLSTGAQDVLEQCPFAKAAALWYDDCLLRYSNGRFASNVDDCLLRCSNERFASNADDGFKVYMWNVNNVTSEWPRFNQSLVSLMSQLTRYAAYNTSAPQPRMFATGMIKFNREHPNITALVQCTRDLSPDECNDCLTNIISKLPKCCNQKIGGRVLALSCNFRYEFYSFYNGTSRLSLPAIAATPPGPAPRPAPPATNTTGNNPTDKGNKKNDTGMILAIAIPVGAALVLLLVCCMIFLRRKGSAMKYPRADGQQIATEIELVFDLQNIKNVTNNFSEANKLGEGGFGAVYKGTLTDGQEIAVKRLSAGSGQGVQELRNEVVLLAKLQHRNLIRLLGVCIEGEEKLLVYEYVPNKSLDTILFDPIKKLQLHWERRYKIITGVARGLLYLHEESQVKIIHRDLKASNILLDANTNPKISDFGLARLFGEDQTQANTIRVAGTFGYMSPEYVMRGQFSNKLDVFSFGVSVLEIVTGRRSSDTFNINSHNSPSLPSYVWSHWSNGTLSAIVDPSLSNYSQNEVSRCIEIGLMCVQEAPTDRPTMSEVVIMLNSYSSFDLAPLRPAFHYGYSTTGSLHHRRNNNDQSEGVQSRSSTNSAVHSRNELSITELGLR